MDKWSDDQMNKMRLGGNRPFKEFMEGYAKEEGGWRKGMSIAEKYKTWAAAQYREKVRVGVNRVEVMPSPRGYLDFFPSCY
jgi:ADP-ribosylation factor GTPase-activating protein 1